MRVRRRQIIEAVCRITVKGGLASATFREVAAEAGVSVRLVQYYFGTKDELMLSTQRHVARAGDGAHQRTCRSGRHVATRGAARHPDVLHPDRRRESREHAHVRRAAHGRRSSIPRLFRAEARDVPDALHTTIAQPAATGTPAHGCRSRHGSGRVLAGLVPSLAQAVLDGIANCRHRRSPSSTTRSDRALL